MIIKTFRKVVRRVFFGEETVLVYGYLDIQRNYYVQIKALSEFLTGNNFGRKDQNSYEIKFVTDILDLVNKSEGLFTNRELEVAISDLKIMDFKATDFYSNAIKNLILYKIGICKSIEACILTEFEFEQVYNFVKISGHIANENIYRIKGFLYQLT